LDISCRVVFSSHKWNKKEGSPSSFWRKRQFISLNSSVFIENLPSLERARARARANHAKIDAQKGCTMQLNVITLNGVEKSEIWVLNRVRVWAPRPHHPIIGLPEHLLSTPLWALDTATCYHKKFSVSFLLVSKVSETFIFKSVNYWFIF